MPHLTGFFAEFSDLDRVTSNDISSWLKGKPDSHVIVNFFGNRLLYPQTIALNSAELEMDFAILREAVKQKPDLVYDSKNSKLFLQQSLLERFPPVSRLAGAIIEAINPVGVTKIYIKGEGVVKPAGTLISPPDIEKLPQDKNGVKIEVNGVEGHLKLNTLSISAISQTEAKIKIGSKNYDVTGGILGVIIDLRIKTERE